MTGKNEGVLPPLEGSMLEMMLELYEHQLREEFDAGPTRQRAVSFNVWARLAMEHALGMAEKAKPDSGLDYLGLIREGVKDFKHKNSV